MTMIPKFPAVPDLTNEQIEELTIEVFCNDQKIKKADLIFVFGSTDPGAFQKTLDAYQKGIIKEILISGRGATHGKKHESWMDGSKSEAQSIKDKLLLNGVPEEIINIEDRSTNSKENVLYSKQIFDFSNISSLLFVSKCHAAGRQYRTLRKYLPNNIEMGPYSYETIINGIYINQFNWMLYPESRSLIFGEYLRILYYSHKGDIECVKGIVNGLESYIERIFEG